MRFLSADYLFTLKDEPIKNGVIQIDNSGKIYFPNSKRFFQTEMNGNFKEYESTVTKEILAASPNPMAPTDQGRSKVQNLRG